MAQGGGVQGRAAGGCGTLRPTGGGGGTGQGRAGVTPRTPLLGHGGLQSSRAPPHDPKVTVAPEGGGTTQLSEDADTRILRTAPGSGSGGAALQAVAVSSSQ